MSNINSLIVDSPKRFKVSIEYVVREKSEVTIIADTKEQAERYALSGWRAQHTEQCFDPKVKGIVEI